MRKGDSHTVGAVLSVLRALTARLPGAEEYVMVHHPAFRVGRKHFAIVGMQQASRGETLSINLGRDMQQQLLDDARFDRTPYIGQHGWVTVAHADLRKGELELLTTESWRRVASARQRTQFEQTLTKTSSSKPARRKN